MGLRDTILTADTSKAEPVDVPEWGVKVELRSLSARQRAKLLQPSVDRGGGTTDLSEMYWLALLLGVFDPDTSLPVFEESDKDTVMEQNGALIDRLAVKILQMSGMSAGDLGEGRGASPTIPSVDSPSS